MSLAIPLGAMQGVLFSSVAPANAAFVRRGAASTSKTRGVTVVPRAGADEDVYIGKGRWVKDNPKKYASRDDWFTGGWPGGEVGLKEGFNIESAGVYESVSGMLPAGDVRRGITSTGVTNTSSEPLSSSSDSSRDETTADNNASSSVVDSLKYKILKCLSTLDRGNAAGEEDRQVIRDLVDQLEAAAASDETKTFSPADEQLEAALNGEWRLAWSTTFAGEQAGSQGFTGAPGGGSLGSVYQRIQCEGKTCDNVVSLAGSGGGGLLPSLSGAASLGHTYEVTGATMRITFTGVTVETDMFGIGPVTLPSPLDALPSELREGLQKAGAQSGAFNTTFIDDDVRISRGDRGETRVFVRLVECFF